MLAALAFTAAFAPSAEDLFNASAFDVAGLVRDADVTGDGKLNFEEFQNLKRDIIDPAAADPQANMRLLLKRVTDNDKGLQLLREQMNRIERLLEESLGKSGAGAQAEARDGSADASGAPAAKLPPLPNAPLSPGREE